MCGNHYLVNSHSQGSKLIFVPCGHCESCRDSLKVQWTFRLRTELEFCRQQKWHIGFFTLTYSDEHLPHFPDDAFVDAPSVKVPCFSRTHARTFIDNIRKAVHRDYKVKGLRYMLCCEYGSHTQRPHMHGIIAFPSSVKDAEGHDILLSPEYIFGLIHHYWDPYGFVFPRDIRGGVDSNGYNHKPFLCVGDVAKAAGYAAKYCCKDLDFYGSIPCPLVDKDSDFYPFLREYLPFHIQSKSIGLQYLSTLSNDKLLKLLQDGESFVGQTKRKPLPIYIKNKILYDLSYEFVDASAFTDDVKGKDWLWSPEKNKFVYKRGQGDFVRKVIRNPSSFLLRNYEAIYAQKKAYYEDLFAHMHEVSYWTNRGICSESAYAITDKIKHLPASDMADYYLGYYGVDSAKWYSPKSSVSWLNRYLSDLRYSANVACEPWDFSSSFCEYMETVGECLKFVLDEFRYALTFVKKKRDFVRYVGDYWKSAV